MPDPLSDPDDSSEIPPRRRTIPPETPEPADPPTPGLATERWALGCLGYIVLSICWFTLVPFASRALTGETIRVEHALTGWAVTTVALLGLALWLRLKFGYKGYGYGILSVLGAGALILLGLFLLLRAICGTGSGSGHSGW